MFADYQNGLVNLSASILKSFGVEPAHPTLPQMDALLAHPFSNVVVILLDGMGSAQPESSRLSTNTIGANARVNFRI